MVELYEIPEMCIEATDMTLFTNSYLEQIKLLKSRGVKIPRKTVKKIIRFYGKNILEDQ